MDSKQKANFVTLNQDDPSLLKQKQDSKSAINQDGGVSDQKPAQGVQGEAAEVPRVHRPVSRSASR